MGFTTPCFIRKNTEELRKKLEDIGYKNAGSSNHHDIIYTDTEHGVYFTTFASNITDDEVAYDCKYNRTLFLAIAALRDDTDNNQMFINGKGDWGIYRDGSDGGLSGIDFYGMPNDLNVDNYHKATVEELIEHFKGKEESCQDL
jgi:hypothetical protein